MSVSLPGSSRRLPFRAGGFSSLAEGLDYAARGETGFSFFGPRGTLETALGYRELRERALDLAVRLGSLRLERGDRVGLIAETGPEFIALFFACQYAGLVPVPLPLSINFAGHEAYVDRIAAVLRTAKVGAVFGPPDLEQLLRQAVAAAGTGRLSSMTELKAQPAGGRVAPLGADETCYIQFSSGSTRAPKGILVTQRALMANVDATARQGLAIGAGDRCVSWLPLYHDMGLVGCCLTPVLVQGSVDFLASTSFARRPLLWLKLIAQQGGTIAFSPTFGYQLCARRAAAADLAGLDLRTWRVAGVGAEMIRPSALAAFAQAFAGAGFDRRAFLPSFGLAEATLVVTLTEPGAGYALDHVERGPAFDRMGLAVAAGDEPDGGGPPIRSFVVCGRPLPGHEVEIRDRDGGRLPERSVGRIHVRGPSVMQHYIALDDEIASPLTADGWLDTGDLGYLAAGSLIVTGRSKDLIIINGRNIWPEDLEWAAERVEGVRAGDAAAFSVNDKERGERVVLAVECRHGSVERQADLRRAVQATLQEASGVEASVLLVAPRSLPLTTSGKLSRALARAAYLGGGLPDLAAIPAREPSTMPAPPELSRDLPWAG